MCHKSMKKEATELVINCVHLVVDAKSMTKIVIFLQVGSWFCITVDTRYVDEELSLDGTMHRYVSGCTERFRDSVVQSAHLLPRLIILQSTN